MTLRFWTIQQGWRTIHLLINFLNIFNWHWALYSAWSSIFRHLDFIRAIPITLCSLQHYVFLKTSSYFFINTWNTELYVPLLLRKNKSRYKIWHWLELGCSCEWRQPKNKKTWPMAGFLCRYGFISNLCFYIDLLYSKAGYNEPMQGWYPRICG